MKNNRKWNKLFLLGSAVIALVSIFASCSNDSTGGNAGLGQTGGSIISTPSSARSIQQVITNDTKVSPEAVGNRKLYSATYDNNTSTYTLVYKIGRISDLFSAYVTQGQQAGTGNVLTYTTNQQSSRSMGINTTASASISVGVEAGVSAFRVNLKSSMETTIGVSVAVTNTTEQAVGSGASYAFDLSNLDKSKKYAIAGFSSMDFYQVFTYKDNGTVTPLMENGKLLVYYDILDLFSFGIYEYVPVNEIEYKTLEAWNSFKPNFSDADKRILNAAKNNEASESTETEILMSTGAIQGGGIYTGNGDNDISSRSNGKTYCEFEITGAQLTNPRSTDKSIYDKLEVDCKLIVKEDQSDGTEITLIKKVTLDLSKYKAIELLPPRTGKFKGRYNGQSYAWLEVPLDDNSGLIKDLKIKIDGPGDDKDNVGFSASLNIKIKQSTK